MPLTLYQFSGWRLILVTHDLYSSLAADDVMLTSLFGHN